MKRNPPRKWTPVQVRVNPKGQVQLKISPTTLQNNPSVREALTRLGAEDLEGVTSGGKMTLAGAKARLRRIAEAQGGSLTKSGEFVDLPRDPHVVGYGATPVGNGRYIIVSVPRGERNPATTPTRLTYREAAHDAGLLRQYLAEHYGQLFKFGGSATRLEAGRRLARSLARMTGKPMKAIMRQASRDANIIYGG